MTSHSVFIYTISASPYHRKKAMNSILLRLTKLHIHLVGGKFVRTQTMKTPNGKEQEVAIFSSDKPISLGECTPFKTIIIHKSVLNNERLSNYGLIHEMAHKKQWWSFFKIPLCLLVFFSLIYGRCVIMCVLALVILFAFSWILELNADFVVIKHIESEAFLGIRGELRKIHKPTVSSIIISRLTHPPMGVTVRIWRWLHKQEKF
jgi:hypothetical protein